MALENDFLTFSCASGANVLTQAAYAAAPATATGYVSGTASSAAVNKTLRQTSIMAAMIAQFIIDKAVQPVVDDGTTSTIETNFTAAILAVAETLNIPISQVTGLSSALANLLPLTGNAVSASKLATARNIALTGTVTGAVNFDGTANVSIATAIADGALTIAKTNGLSSAIAGCVQKAGDTMTGQLTVPIASVINAGANVSMNFGYNGSVNNGFYLNANSLGFSLNVLNGAGGFLAQAFLVNAAGTSVSFNSSILVPGTMAIGTAGGLIYETSPGNGVVGVRSGVAGSPKYFSFGADGTFSALSGSIVASGGFQISDRRLKYNITARHVQRGFALKIARMFCEWDRVVDGVHDVGLVAQRVRRVASRYVQTFAHGERGVKRLAIDKAGIALEASLDNALHLNDHDKTIRALLKRIEKLEKAA